MIKDITKITDAEFDKGVEDIFIALEDTRRNLNNKEEIKKSLIIICDCYTIVGTQYGFLQSKFEYYKKLMDVVSERIEGNLTLPQRKSLAYKELINYNDKGEVVDVIERYQTSKTRFNRLKALLDVMNMQKDIITNLVNLEK